MTVKDYNCGLRPALRNEELSSTYSRLVLQVLLLFSFLYMEIQMEQSKGIVGKMDCKKGTYLVWKDLSVIIPNFGSIEPARKLLHGLHGYAEPGRIMAIMGPSGSGKSTLLDSLAGRLSTNVTMTGDIFLNGRKKRPGFGNAAYVTQEDVLLGTLTVRETITYSALLRLPNAMSKKEIAEVAEETILEMGLEDCADRLIGNWHLRGISGGEKKRVSIALEILTKPRLLFLDEPTSGLDSASAFFVVQTLRAVAQDGRTVVSSIHQPSSEVFALFDDLFLLSGGECVYFGEAKKAIEFFAEAGVPCPSRRSPSDHFLRCINSDFDAVTSTLKGSQRYYITQKLSDPLVNMATAEIKERLIRTYKSSKYVKQTHRRIQELTTAVDVGMDVPKDSKASWLKQLMILTQRSFLNMTRDMGYYWLRIAIYIILSFCVGTVYFDVGTTYTAILARGACGGFITGFMTFMSIGGFPSFVEEMKIFYKEWRNGHYGVAVFILSNFLSSFPFLVAVALSSGTITYFMVQFRDEFSHYVYFVMIVFLSISIVESCMMVVASLVPNFLMGIITGAGVIGIMMMTSGFFRLLPDLPKPIWRYPISYLSYGSWALQGHYKNDLIGLEFDPLIPGDPKLSGEYIVTQMFKVSLDHSKWCDIAALVALLVFFRLLFFMILKLKEKLIPVIQMIRSKKAQNDLKKLSLRVKVPSFRVPSMRVSSDRHCSGRCNVPPLSSQEGDVSPVYD